MSSDDRLSCSRCASSAVEFRARGATARAARRRLARVAPGRDPRRRRRVGLRQVDPGAGDARPAADRSPARSCSTARRSAGKAGLRELRRRVQMIFQDPYQTLNPRQRVRTIVAEPLRGAGGRRRRARRAGRARARRRRPRARALPRALSAPALGRPAPAGGDRRGARARARRADLRRAGLDARRLGAGADPRRAARAAENGASWRCCSSPTTSASPGRCATGSPSCTWAGSSSRAAPPT